jgi:hypothetical protein
VRSPFLCSGVGLPYFIEYSGVTAVVTSAAITPQTAGRSGNPSPLHTALRTTPPQSGPVTSSRGRCLAWSCAAGWPCRPRRREARLRGPGSESYPAERVPRERGPLVRADDVAPGKVHLRGSWHVRCLLPLPRTCPVPGGHGDFRGLRARHAQGQRATTTSWRGPSRPLAGESATVTADLRPRSPSTKYCRPLRATTSGPGSVARSSARDGAGPGGHATVPPARRRPPWRTTTTSSRRRWGRDLSSAHRPRPPLPPSRATTESWRQRRGRLPEPGVGSNGARSRPPYAVLCAVVDASTRRLRRHTLALRWNQIGEANGR